MTAMHRYILRATIVVVVIGALAVACVRTLFGAQDRDPPTPIRAVAITMEPKVEMSGAITSILVTAHMQRVEILPSGEAQVKHLGSVQFDLMKNKGETVMVSGNRRAYSDLAAGIYAAAMQEWRDTLSAPDPHAPPPLPEQDRRALRSQQQP